MQECKNILMELRMRIHGSDIENCIELTLKN